MGRIGLLGGTFDPPHLGHLLLAEWCRETLQLDAVWFIPAADPPHKQGQVIAAVEHRMAMLSLALQNNPQFVISRIDLDRPGPHYSADMVALARQQQPEAELLLLIGSDSLRDLPSWHDPQRLLEQCQLAVYRRYEINCDLDELIRQLPTLRERLTFVDGPLINLSATDIRQRVCSGRSIRYLVPDAVRDYITSHTLYTQEE